MLSERELEIEVIKTPQGNVPTINGLQTAINAMTEQMKPLVDIITSIQDTSDNIQDALESMALNIQQISDNLAEFLVLMAKINTNISDVLERFQSESTESLKYQQSNLIELQTILAKLLVEFQKNIAKITPVKES